MSGVPAITEREQIELACVTHNDGPTTEGTAVNANWSAIVNSIRDVEGVQRTVLVAG